MKKQRYMIMCNFLLVAHEVSIQIYRSGEKRTNSASCAAVVQWVKAYASHAEGRGSNSGCDRHVVTIPVLKSLATDLIILGLATVHR